MVVNGKPTNLMAAVKTAKEEREKREKKSKEEQERLKTIILINWRQTSSSGFWTKCFKCVPFEVLKNTYDHIAELTKGGYPVYNPAGLFVSILKKLGHVPLKEVMKIGKEYN